MALRWLGRILRRQSSPSTFDLRALQAHVGYRFRDHTLLEQALKHRSYVYAHQGTGVESNERLEYLGDAVLDVLVADFLYREYQSLREGDLTQMKSLVVSRTILAAKASSIDLDHFILLSPEERRAGGAVQPSILDDALEAFRPPVWHETEWLARRIRALLPLPGDAATPAGGQRRAATSRQAG